MGSALDFAFPMISLPTKAAISAGSTLYDTATNKAGKEANKLAADQLAQQKKMEEELKARMANEESIASVSAQGKSARERQRRSALGSAGRGSTILTSPLGLTGEPDVARKSLLGL